MQQRPVTLYLPPSYFAIRPKQPKQKKGCNILQVLLGWWLGTNYRDLTHLSCVLQEASTITIVAIAELVS